MTKVTAEEHQFNGTVTAGDSVALYVNGTEFKGYTVKEGYEGKITFNYQEKEVPTE